MSKSTLLTSLLLLLCFASLLHSIDTYMFVRRKINGHVVPHVDVYHIMPPRKEPVALPINAGRVLMRTNPSTGRYNATTPVDQREWAVMFPASMSPTGAGIYRLHSHDHPSEANRAVFVAMYHEIHCIQVFANSLVENHKADWPHIGDCLNYIRQMAMCRPDLTVEPGKFMDDQFITATTGSLHVCQDWRTPQQFLEIDDKIWYSLTTKNLTT